MNLLIDLLKKPGLRVISKEKDFYPENLILKPFIKNSYVLYENKKTLLIGEITELEKDHFKIENSEMSMVVISNSETKYVNKYIENQEKGLF